MAIDIFRPYDPVTNDYDMSDIQIALAELEIIKNEQLERQKPGLASNELDHQ